VKHTTPINGTWLRVSRHEQFPILSGEVGRSVTRLEAEQLGEQDRLLARRAGAAKPEEAAEAVAVGAALLAEVLLAARGALEEPVGEQLGAAFELGH
ncbi:MAG TPA: hypothetical protein VFN05_01605, partial [Actinomycetes bacterium]|nr:hypothetical protein [Actinomycetes bacterium]